MNPAPASLARRLSRLTLVRIAPLCLLALLLLPAPRLTADEGATPQPRADQAPALPLTATFEKVTGGDSGPYVLHLKNTSAEAVTVSAKILLSVAFHAESKARNIPDHVINAGEVWSIPDLASSDRVVVTAANFAPLELTVP